MGVWNSYNCYTVIVDVCLLVQFLLKLSVLLDGPVNSSQYPFRGGTGGNLGRRVLRLGAPAARTGHHLGEELSC